MEPRVQISYGTAFDVLVAAAAVADPAWRTTFDAGETTHDRVRSATDDGFVRRVGDFGRFGWINLAGLMAADPGPWGVARLVDAVRATPPEDLHVLMLGGDRRQLLAVVGEPVLRRAVRGDLRARTRLATALTSEELVIEVTPWLVGTDSAAVHATVVDLLHTWREVLLPPAAEAALSRILRDDAAVAEALLGASTGRTYLDTAIGGLHYDPAGLDRVVSVSSTQVSPVVVVVDGRTHTVILHPPVVGPQREPEPGDRLVVLGRAVGDRNRGQLLTMLLDGEKTAVDLARGMGAPRTTLLHHLAILRAAGLIHVTVTPGGATLYRLRSEGFTELSDAAGTFVPAGTDSAPAKTGSVPTG